MKQPGMFSLDKGLWRLRTEETGQTEQVEPMFKMLKCMGVGKMKSRVT
jgi:hypothetical protein